MDAESVEFLPLFYLLVERRLSVAVLATAIEKEGIFGFDRYGRFKCFSKDDPEARIALDALAEQYRTFGDPDVPYALDTVQWESVFERFGWPEMRCPAFDSIDPHDAPVPEKLLQRASAKAENNYLRLIGGLLAFVRGDHGAGRHPEYQSEAQLQKWLALKLNAPGMGERHLQSVFKAAKQALDDALS